MPNAPRLFFRHPGLLAAVVFAALSGCKPAPQTTAAQQTPLPDGSALRQPTASDFQAFFQSLLPATVRISEVKMDAPRRFPNALPTSNAWLLSVKITLIPVEDLLSLPSSEDTQSIDNSVAELNSLVMWRNAYTNSPYVKACGAFEVKLPASPMPQLLVITQPKNQPLPPIYTKASAEWQIDHWQFEPTNDPSNTRATDVGKLRSDFTGATMVKGSLEAEKVQREVQSAIAQGRKEIDAIRVRYAEQIVNGTKSGTVYTGKVSYGPNVAPCELRFLDPPLNSDPRFVSFQITLSSQNPPCWYIYKGRVTTELPIPVPGPQPTPTNTNPTFDSDVSNRVPERNVFQNLVRSSNLKVGRGTLASWLGSNEHGGQSLLLLNGRIEGTINDFGALPGIQLSVQQKP